MITQASLASLAIGLLLSCAGHAQPREVIASKAAASPTAKVKVKVAPRALPADAVRPSQPTAEERAYSNLVDDVSKSMDAFADDNITANQGRDHLGDPPADASTKDADGKAPVATRKGKRP